MFWAVVINGDGAPHGSDGAVCTHRTEHQQCLTSTKGHVLGYGHNFTMFDASGFLLAS